MFMQTLLEEINELIDKVSILLTLPVGQHDEKLVAFYAANRRNMHDIKQSMTKVWQRFHEEGEDALREADLESLRDKLQQTVQEISSFTMLVVLRDALQDKLRDGDEG